jgi:ketosteroid isomerase-like protein
VGIPHIISDRAVSISSIFRGGQFLTIDGEKELALKIAILSTLTLLGSGLSLSCHHGADDSEPATIIAMERENLNRWGNGDPQGYLDRYAPEVTYFDPEQEKRTDGRDAMRKYYAPIAGKIKIDHYDMLDPKVQRHGDVAILSYNLVNYGKTNGTDSVLNRWNSTKVYARIEGEWKIVHDHWSYVKPELKTPAAN